MVCMCRHNIAGVWNRGGGRLNQINAQRTAQRDNAQRTTHNAQRTTHNLQLLTANARRLATIAIAVATLCAFWFANNAAAQQTSVDYSASPSELVSVNADGQLIVLPQANAGLMTATIEAAGYTLNAQNQYVRSGFDGERYITLNILGVCTIGGGCGAFGLQGLDQQGRIAAFRAWDLTTLSMFIASGADLNEQITIDSSENTPLDLVADSYDNNAASNLTIFGSVLRNAGGVCNEFATSIDPEHVEVCGTKLITTEVIEQIATRRASVRFTGSRIFGGSFFYVFSTNIRFLVTLPPLPVTPPIVINTGKRNWNAEATEAGFELQNAGVVIESNFSQIPVGRRLGLGPDNSYVITVVEGSERFVSITTTTEVTMVADSSAEMPMMSIPAMAKIIIAAQFRSPPSSSFPPLSFPPSSPIMIKYALAKNLRIASSIPPLLKVVRQKGLRQTRRR